MCVALVIHAVIIVLHCLLLASLNSMDKCCYYVLHCLLHESKSWHFMSCFHVSCSCMNPAIQRHEALTCIVLSCMRLTSGIQPNA